MKLSIFMLTHGRLSLLKPCLRSVLDALPAESEVVVVLNGSHPETARWLAEVCDDRVRWLEKREELPGQCRNLAFTVCRGEIIHFLDDDVVVPPDIFSNLLMRFATDPDVAILGGPNITPADSPWNEKLYGAMMTSAFAAPMIRRRYMSHARENERETSERELILCNLAMRKAMIPPAVRFRDTLLCNEENLFLYDCRRHRLKIRFSAAIFVEHRRRGTLSRFLAQILRYGTGRGQQTAIAPRSCHPAFLAPAIAVAIGL